MLAPKSEIRVHDGSVGALNIKINLDGAASWNGRTADELLDEVFEPFQHGRPAGRVHLVAVNDGRLLEWIGSYEDRHGETRLTRQLAEALGRGERGLDPHIRFIELNQRSLVGGIKDGADRVSTEFVDEMIAKLVGGTDVQDIWQACNECTAQSAVLHAGLSRDDGRKSRTCCVGSRNSTSAASDGGVSGGSSAQRSAHHGSRAERSAAVTYCSGCMRVRICTRICR